MTVKELIASLAKYPPDAEVWYIECFFGDLSSEVRDGDIEMQGGKLVIGHDGSHCADGD
jgi:hypothetical protein